MAKTNKTARCQICNRITRVTRDGTFGQHNVKQTTVHQRLAMTVEERRVALATCEGSGKIP